MRAKAICTIMLTLILISTLNIGFNLKLVGAETSELTTLSKNDKTSPAKTSDDACYDIFQKDQGAEGDGEVSSRSPPNMEDRRNLNDTNQWSDFVFVDGNLTRIIVGINNEEPNSYLELEKLVDKYNSNIVNTVAINGKIIAAVVEISIYSASAFMQDARATEFSSYVESNMKFQVSLVPNDPYWSYQWGPVKIEADWAWNTTLGDPSILVAVVDTGIDYNHTDIAANYVPLGYDWVNNDPYPWDDNGHGTHCAGIIAAEINNSIGIAGLAQVQIMAEKALDQWGYGYADWLASAIIHAVNQSADIISMSWGGYGHSELIYEAMQYAYDAGVLLVAAAGNDNTDLKLYPAGYDEVIAVTATNMYDERPWWSNFGDWVELAAPGVDIYSTVPWGYTYGSGTSMSTPHVAGVAALVWSQFPNVTRDWVRLWLQYTADDIGDPGFDIYYGYGRINARKAVEETPSDHELIIVEWETPPYVEPGAHAVINTTILNFGASDESNVTVQLLVNSSLVDFVTIDYLASYNYVTVSCSWSPTVEGFYNVTSYVVPVQNETIIENNVVWTYIYVGYPVKAVVLHSAGNIISDIITTWQVLNTEWYRFGDTMVHIDYTTLNKDDITYQDLSASDADVLIISCAYDPWMGWEFTDSEIDAISTYVREGHGLIATAGTLYYYVPNNNKLAPLFGLNETIIWYATGTDLLHLINTTHPIFRNVPNPHVFLEVGTAIPSDWKWDSNELVEGKYVALGHYEESAIVTYRGLVYISPWLEIIPAYYHHHLQLLYNAITWSRYQKPEHELVVSLEAPRHLQPSESALLNATISNMGLNNETDVELLLLVDGTIVNSTVISELLVGASYTINYLWTPTVEAVTNITAYAPPLPGEEFTFNNVDSAIIYVHFVRMVLWDDTKDTDGDSLTGNYLSLYQLLTTSGFVVDELTVGPINSTILANYDVLVLMDPELDFLPSEIADIQNWVAIGGALIIIPDGGYPPTINTLMSPYGVQMTGLVGGYGATTNIVGHSITLDIESIYVDWVREISVTSPSTCLAWTTELYAFLSATGGHEVVVVSDSNIMDNPRLGMADNTRLMLNIFHWASIKLEHDLSVTLEAPAFLEPDTSVLLNATVINRGLNNETNVELQLLINGTIVDSVVIPQLLTRSSYTLNYTWTPTIEGIYNVTAHALPVAGEEYTLNNVATKMVFVRVIIKVAVLGDYYSQLTDLLLENYIFAHERDWDVIGDIYEYDLVIVNRPSDPGATTFLTLIEAADQYRVGLVFTSSWPGSDVPYGISLLQWYLGDPVGQGDTYGQGSVYYEVVQEHLIFEDWNISDQIYIITTGDRDHAWFWGYSGETIGNIGADYTGIRGGGVAYNVRESGNIHLLLAGLAPQFYANTTHWTDEAKLIFVRGVLWAVAPEHDLAVSLDAPAFVELGKTSQLNATVTNHGLKNETNVELQILVNGTRVANVTIPKLMTNSSYPFNCTWTPAIEGTYNVTAYAPPVQNETFTANNIATKMVPVFKMAYIYVDPSLTTVFLGESFTISVNISDVKDLYGLDIQLNWDSSLLDYVSHTVKIPVEDHPDGILHGPILMLKDEVNSTAGTYWLAYTSMLPAPSFNGSGIVFNITFNAKAVGECPLDLYSTDLASAPRPVAQPIPHISVDGEVKIEQPPIIRDVAITNVTVPRTSIYTGHTINITVVAKNIGNATENFTVTAYYGNTSIETQTVTDLAPSEEITLTFVWNTTNVSPCMNYTIWAEASVVPGETNMDDNVFIDGEVHVKMLGDINGDGVIDIYDVVLVAAAYGSEPGDPNWNPDADLAPQYKLINIYDLVTVAALFGTCA